MEYNTKSAAEDLLARMMLYNKGEMSNAYIVKNLEKFKSAIIIQGMIKNDLIIGYTNQQVYDLYCGVAHEMNISPMNQIDFSRTLCKYYAFECKVTRVDGELQRIYIHGDENRYVYNHCESEEMKQTKSQVQYASNIISLDDIIGHQNDEIYDQYVTWCKENELSVGSKIAFSKIICSIFNVQTVVKRTGKKLSRVYEALEGDGKTANLLCV